MREELDAKLCEKYPLLFRDRNAPMTQTCMCWGFCCGDGWYNLIDMLCAHLTSKYNCAKESYEFAKDCFENHGGVLPWGSKNIITGDEVEERRLKMEEEAEKVPTVVQVKEKFGTLRFYVDRATDEHYNYIHFAEAMSSRICEDCGMSDETTRTWGMGWHATLCKKHAIERYGEEEVEEYLKGDDNGDE
jgi:hypothetical protein